MKKKQIKVNNYGRRKTDMTPEEKYVTYKWLIGVSLTILGLTISVVGIVYGILSTSLNTKVNTELYTSQYRVLCSDIDYIKSTLHENNRMINMIEKNQILVLRSLKINPVKE